MKKLLLFIFLLGSFTAFSQGTVTGTLIDAETGDTLPSANIVETGTSNGTVSDMDGNFSLNVSNDQGTITVSFVGYSTTVVDYTLVNGTANLGNISVGLDADSLGEIVIVGTGVIDLAEDRKTPVAVSTIKAEEIQRKAVGNVEITEAVKSTPSAYISGQTGFGDSQLYLRGFDQTNIAVLLNGQPVNGMEDGRVYWSNWAGIADIANAIQVQRGLGSSKLAISSVGGTMNIVMKAAERNKGGYARFVGGNDSYFKGTLAYDTGKNDKGWAFSVLVDYWQAHRKWARGTYGEGQNYFFAVGYKPNETHAFNFLITGAPQLHGQKWSQSKEVIAADPKFNQHWGYTSDGIESERQNYYHKPVMNLNWDWTMSDKTELGTVLYASWGRGGGTGPRGARAPRTEDPDGDGPLFGQIDYDGIAALNAEVGLGDNDKRAGYIRRASVNNHQWYGLISNLGHEFSDTFSANVGVDVRMYTGDHFRQVTDLYGLTGWANDRPDGATVTNTFDPTPWAALFDFADEGDRIDYDYSEDINYQGVFGQLEYATDSFSAFFQGAFSNQSYQREGRFSDPGTSEKLTKTGYNLKGGLSYTIDDTHTIFLNAGYYSRQPYLDNIFEFIRVSNAIIEPEVDNEEITGFEAGYHFKIANFRANFNAYVTDWDNRTLLSSGEIDPNGIPGDGDEIETDIFQRGVRQYHTGAEFDFSYRPCTGVTINGYLSGGSWYYKGESNFAIYNGDTNELLEEADGVDRSGIKVSTAPQFAAGLGVVAKIIAGLSVDANINYYANHYEYTDLNTTENPDKLRPFSLTDAGLTYKFNLGSNDLTFRGNVYNVLDHVTIQNSDAFGFFNNNGRTYNGSIKYAF